MLCDDLNSNGVSKGNRRNLTMAILGAKIMLLDMDLLEV